MRFSINLQEADRTFKMANPDYCHRVTADGEIGNQRLRDFSEL